MIEIVCMVVFSVMYSEEGRDFLLLLLGIMALLLIVCSLLCP